MHHHFEWLFLFYFYDKWNLKKEKSSLFIKMRKRKIIFAFSIKQHLNKVLDNDKIEP
jgi:hypothetical protein